MVNSLAGQTIYEPDHVFSSLPLSDEINCVIGTDSASISRLSSTTTIVNYNILSLKADKGGFRVRLGNISNAAMPADEVPGAAVTDGTGGWYIKEGTTLNLPNPQIVTVKGYAADSVLSYIWI